MVKYLENQSKESLISMNEKIKAILEFDPSADAQERLLRVFEYLLQNLGVEKRYLTIEELSKYISTPKGTIYAWTHMRKIPHSKVGRILRFDKQEIDQWMKKKKVKVFDYKKHLGVE